MVFKRTAAEIERQEKMILSPGIYIIKCIPNGKVYIGQSKNMYSRIGNHFSLLESRSHAVKALQEDYIKYGNNSFAPQEVEIIKNPQERIKRESEIIKKHPPSLLYNYAQRIANRCKNPPERKLIVILIPSYLLALIKKDAREESRKISPMIRRILELHYENKL